MLKNKFFYGWWMVIASTIMSFVADGSLFFGFTVFFNPIRQTFGWSAAVMSIAFSIHRIGMGILSPIVGVLVDRVGPRKLMLFGWTVFGLGFLLISRVNSLWEFYGAFLVLTVGLSFGFFLVINTTIANWFIKKRSRAYSIISAGMASSGMLVPLLALIVEQFGWRTSLVIVAVTLWVVGLPLSLVMRQRPSQHGLLPDGETIVAMNESIDVSASQQENDSFSPEVNTQDPSFTAREALKTKSFWLLASMSFFQMIGMGSVWIHIVPYLESIYIPTTVGAFAVSGMTISSLIGRLGLGFLGDFMNKRYLIALSFSLQAIGLFLFSVIAVDKIWLIILFLLTYAPGYGAVISLTPALQADYYGSKNFGAIAGLILIVSMLGGIASPVVAGWIFDVTGSYRLAWRIFSLVVVPAVPLILMAKTPGNK
ncbi:MFS transporter [Chloroflexota bacterium]